MSWVILDSPSRHLPFTANDLYEFEGFEGTKEKCFRITLYRKTVIYLGLFLSVQFTVSQALRNQVLEADVSELLVNSFIQTFEKKFCDLVLYIFSV